MFYFRGMLHFEVEYGNTYLTNDVIYGIISSSSCSINHEGRHMKKFQLFWLDGKTEIVEGTDIADAFRRAGYGNGAISALDYYKEIT